MNIYKYFVVHRLYIYIYLFIYLYIIYIYIRNISELCIFMFRMGTFESRRFLLSVNSKKSPQTAVQPVMFPAFFGQLN